VALFMEVKGVLGGGGGKGCSSSGKGVSWWCLLVKRWVCWSKQVSSVTYPCLCSRHGKCRGFFLVGE